MTMIMALAPLMSPTIGGFIDQYSGWRTSFYFVAIMGIIAYIFAFKIPARNQSSTDRQH